MTHFMNRHPAQSPTLSGFKILILGLIAILPFRLGTLVHLVRPAAGFHIFNVLLILVVVGWILHASNRRAKLIPSTPLNAPLILLVLWSAAALFMSWMRLPPHQFETARYAFFKWIQFLPLYFIVAGTMQSRKDLKRTAAIMIAVTFIAAFFVIKDHQHMSYLTSGPKVERGGGIFYQPNHAGAYFTYSVPIILSLGLWVYRGHRRILLMGVATLALGALLVTYSRGAYLGVAAALLFLATRRKVFRFIIPFSLIILIPVLSVKGLTQRFDELYQVDEFGQEFLEPDANSRIIAFNKAKHIISDSPLIGKGFRSFRYIEVPGFEHIRGVDVHNIFLDFATGTGIIGLSLFLWLMLRALRMCWTIYKQIDDDWINGLALGLTAGLLGFLLVNLTGTRFYDRQIVGHLWVWLGLVASCYRYIHSIPSEKPTRKVA